MASSANQPMNHGMISVNQIVKFFGKACLLTKIENMLGFHQFEVVDILTGHIARAHRYELAATDEVAEWPYCLIFFDYDTLVTERKSLPVVVLSLSGHLHRHQCPATFQERWANLSVT